jgi:hypothetical protein
VCLVATPNLSIGREASNSLQEAYAAENPPPFRSYFVTILQERRVPCRIVREKQSIRTEIWEGGSIFPQHVVVGV